MGCRWLYGGGGGIAEVSFGRLGETTFKTNCLRLWRYLGSLYVYFCSFLLCHIPCVCLLGFKVMVDLVCFGLLRPAMAFRL